MRDSHRRILSLGCFILLLARCGASKEGVEAYSRRWPWWIRMRGMAVVVMMMVMGGGGLVGCAITHSVGQKAIADSEMRKRIAVGTTTKGEVKALLGEPEVVVVMDEDEEAWSYVYVAGGWWIGLTEEMSGLSIRFTKGAIVKEKGYGEGKLLASETKKIRDNDTVTSIKPGKTTKTEVEALLGKPYWVSTYEVLAGPEEEEWVYIYIDEGIVAPALAGAGTTLLTGLPFAGTIVSVVAGNVMYSGETSSLSIRFLQEGVIKQIEKCKMTRYAKKPTCVRAINLGLAQ